MDGEEPTVILTVVSIQRGREREINAVNWTQVPRVLSTLQRRDGKVVLRKLTCANRDPLIAYNIL